MITSSYRRSFLELSDIRVATARAGNVIGGGDWAEDRLIPDLVNALMVGEKIQIRNPLAVRPWQHVLEPLSGYLVLCQHLYNGGRKYSQAWNFGPKDDDVKSVEWIVNQMLQKWYYKHPRYHIINDTKHEAKLLRLDCSKAMKELAWTPRWRLNSALDATIYWFVSYLQGRDIKELCEQQIEEYDASVSTQI